MPVTSLPIERSSLFREHPVAAYFLATFAISWTCAFAVAAPHLLRHELLPRMTGILMFPVMLLGPSLSGVVLTLLIDGKTGLRDLIARITRWCLPVTWYAVLLIPPVLVLVVLYGLRTFLSPAYTPNRFLLGLFFGVPAGLLEEIGWMGFAFPKLNLGHNAFSSAISLGLLWSLWHLPVINFLGTAAPHGAYWLPFFLAFALAMTAMRVLISWAYVNTQSVLLAQLLHISSTGSLVLFSPPAVSPAQEVFWYGIYGAALWLVALLLHTKYGNRLDCYGAPGRANLYSR